MIAAGRRLGISGPLAPILIGPNVGGDGFAVLAADRSPLAEGVDLAHAVQSVRFAAVREYREIANGGR